VDPDRRAAPRRRQRFLPDRGRGVGIDGALQADNRLPGFSVVDGQRSPAIEVVRPGRRPTGGIDLVQGDEEVRQCERELPEIGDHSIVAISPSSHR
jgi:hypothetical protein